MISSKTNINGIGALREDINSESKSWRRFYSGMPSYRPILRLYTGTF